MYNQLYITLHFRRRLPGWTILVEETLPATTPDSYPLARADFKNRSLTIEIRPDIDNARAKQICRAIEQSMMFADMEIY